MGASVYTERSNREQYSEETVTSITGVGLSRARLGDRFSAFSRFTLRTFFDRNNRPFRRRGCRLRRPRGCRGRRACGPVGDAELAGVRGDILAVLAAHVRDARANLRLCRSARALPRRHCLDCFLLCLCLLTSARLHHLCRAHVLDFSFIRLWVAEQDTAGMLKRARTSAGPLADHLHRPPRSASSRHNHRVSSPLWAPTANQCPHTGATNARHRSWVYVSVNHRHLSLSVGKVYCQKERESPLN